jgi:hypothetical protein
VHQAHDIQLFSLDGTLAISPTCSNAERRQIYTRPFHADHVAQTADLCKPPIRGEARAIDASPIDRLPVDTVPAR